MPQDTHSPDFFWESIFIKAEEKLFCVPRCGFEESSEVFADMFLLPSENPEGRDAEHPIVLDPAFYKSDDFTSLLRIMYPRAKSLISATDIKLELQKEEWISVLKLSTVWQMHKIREYAIHRLSTDITLTPLEKIQMARDHQVAKWLEEGVKSLVNGDHNLTRDEMSTLGWETSALILWIRNESSKKSNGALRFRKDSIKCANCTTSTSSLFPDKTYCSGCDLYLTPDEELSVPWGSSITGSTCVVSLRAITCNRCSSKPFYSFSSVDCSSCSFHVSLKSNARVTPTMDSHYKIMEVFGAEMDEYRSAFSSNRKETTTQS